MEAWVEPDGASSWPIGRVASHPNVLLNVIRRPSSPISVSTSIVKCLGIQGIQALANVILMHLQMNGGQRLELAELLVVKTRRLPEHLSERRLRLLRPRVQSRGESVPTNRIRQDREDGDNEIAIRVVH